MQVHGHALGHFGCLHVMRQTVLTVNEMQMTVLACMSDSDSRKSPSTLASGLDAGTARMDLLGGLLPPEEGPA